MEFFASAGILERWSFYVAIISILWLKFQLPTWFIVTVVLAVYIFSRGGYKFAVVVFKTFPRDMIGLWRFLHLLVPMKYYQKRNINVPMIFEKNVKEHPDKICYYFDDKTWTYKDISDLSNKISHTFVEAGFKHGDTVALLLDNRPEYVAFWMGLAKAGLATSLLNYNLRDKVLLHSIQIVNCKAVIFGADFTTSIEEIRSQLDPSVKLYAFDFGASGQVPKATINLDALLSKASSGSLPGPQRSNYGDKMLYIYTSGTTGLPKAAIIKHSRFIYASFGAYYMFGLKNNDVLYVTLPMYHTNGGVMGAGIPLLFGTTSVIRKKFSVTNFWTDCIKYQCTVALYIGELCRYLLAAPPRPEDRNHKIRFMFGNGMRPQIWKEFTQRFNIPKIGELYGSTEGNTNIMNYEGKIGSVGFVSLIAPSVLPILLIKVTEDTGEPIRGRDGLCVKCGPGEPGMLVGKIEANHPIREFHGYADPQATSKKIVKDVLVHGDAAFLSGDILVMDELGYLYFQDRTGDTFRWRGENVSTTEVEAVISNVAGLKDCCVYGVEVPGSEGRAGMASILDPDKTLDLTALSKGMSKVLPSYARPLFIRLVSTIDLTGTYKMKKVDLQKEGFDITKIDDAIYFLQASSQTYVPYTTTLHQELISGQIRV